MKKFLYFILVLGLTTGVTGAKEAFEHPVDIQESACKTGTQNLDEWTKCTLKAARAWNSEVDIIHFCIKSSPVMQRLPCMITRNTGIYTKTTNTK